MTHELNDYDKIFIESIVEEVNEMMLERYADEETVPVLGVCRKEDLPGDAALWVHVFKTEEVKERMGK